MIRVQLPAPDLHVVDFDATGWVVDTESGFLTIIKDGNHVAVFAHHEWAYCTDGSEKVVA